VVTIFGDEATAANRALTRVQVLLTEALMQLSSLHLPGVRDRHRVHLERAISRAEAALAMEPGDDARAQRHKVSLLLIKAYGARAEDARYGAGQLSRGAQRAPTSEDCEDGWRRVEEIVKVAEQSAAAAERLATELNHPQAERLSCAAVVAGRDARRIIEERNHAYTFHADPSFSFGEGWYVAAAAVLCGVLIQIEPAQQQTRQAQLFLKEAGLGSRIVPYRPRPRANKALVDIVARGFRADPNTAARKLRTAFLGEEPIPEPVIRWTDLALAGASTEKKVLLWVRYAAHHPERNTNHPELQELCRRVLGKNLIPVLVGDALRDGEVPEGAVDLTLFWKHALFQGEQMRRAQLLFFERMRQAHGLCGQVGVTTAGMDGPALMGLPAMYLTHEPNVRLGRWVGAVPGYEEVVRSDDYLERISATLAKWSQA
jgi:hypothetical protein